MASRLNEIIGETKRTTFFDDYFERKCLLVRQRRPNNISFSLSDFERLLCLPGIRPLLRIVKEQNEDQALAAVNDDGHLNKQYLLSRIAKGYTLVLNDIHRLDAGLQSLAAELGWELGCYCAVNAYLTPAGTQALKPHFDSHDIFALQCHGSKTWHVQMEDTELPTLSTHQPILHQVNENQLQEIDLNAGDAMYLPRGSIHYAVANSEPSLHLTIGLYPIEWKDLLGIIADELAGQHISMRRSIPMGNRRSSDLSDFYSVLDLILTNCNEDLVLRAMARAERELMKRQPQVLAGSLESAIKVSQLTESSLASLWLQRCPEPIIVSSHPGGARLELAGHSFTLPLAAPELVMSLVELETPYLLSDRLNQPISPIVQVVVETLIQKGVLRLASNGQSS
jgi:ribosomal protein L16 Arg81 hydroxylase